MALNQKHRAYQFIRQRLMNGTLPPGSHVSDFALCRQIGVSRTPIREAINQLASEGFLEHVPRYGCFVKKLSREELDELFDLRELLETYAVGRAANRIDGETLAALKGLCADMLSLIKDLRSSGADDLHGDSFRKHIQDDVAFHLLILKAADRPRLLRAVSDLRILTNLFSGRRREPSKSAVRFLSKTYREHCLIVKALERRDVELARQRMKEHLQRAKGMTMDYYDHHDRAAPSAETPDADELYLSEMVRKMEAYNLR